MLKRIGKYLEIFLVMILFYYNVIKFFILYKSEGIDIKYD